MQKRSLLLSFAGLALLTTTSFGQVLFNGNYSQNFSSMGTVTSGNTTTPTGWVIGSGIAATAAASSAATTTVANTPGGATNSGVYNWYTTSTSWYAGGNVLTAASSTPATTSKALQLNLVNDSGQAINALDLSFTGVQWRSNPGTQILQFSYSLNGTTWTSVSDLNFTSIVTSVGNSQVNPANIQNLSSTINLTGSWNNGSSLYLRWYLPNGSSASGFYGLDNVLITVPEPQTWALLGMAGMFGLLRRRSRK